MNQQTSNIKVDDSKKRDLYPIYVKYKKKLAGLRKKQNKIIKNFVKKVKK